MINALLGQEKLSYAHGDTRDQTIQILTEELEPLPGTNISMPPVWSTAKPPAIS